MLPFPVAEDKELNCRQFLCLSDGDGDGDDNENEKGSRIIYYEHLPELQNNCYLGLNYGNWLLVTRPGIDSSPFLFNPITRSQIALPPFPRPSPWIICSPRWNHYHEEHHRLLQENNNNEEEASDKFFGSEFYMHLVYVAVVSSDPARYNSNNDDDVDLVVMVSHGWDTSLIFCRPGDSQWTPVVYEHGDTQQPCRYINSLAHSDDKFYALDSKNNNLLAVVCDIGPHASSNPAVATVVVRLPSLKYDTDLKQHATFLTTSGLSLLLILRPTLKMTEGERFLVYKLREGIEGMKSEGEDEGFVIEVAGEEVEVEAGGADKGEGVIEVAAKGAKVKGETEDVAGCEDMDEDEDGNNDDDDKEEEEEDENEVGDMDEYEDGNDDDDDDEEEEEEEEGDKDEDENEVAVKDEDEDEVGEDEDDYEDEDEEEGEDEDEDIKDEDEDVVYESELEDVVEEKKEEEEEKKDEKGGGGKQSDWSRMQSIGDRAIFISGSNSLTISTSGLNGYSNCIYCSDVSRHGVFFSSNGIQILKYCIPKKKEETRFHYEPKRPCLWRHIWFQPLQAYLVPTSSIPQ